MRRGYLAGQGEHEPHSCDRIGGGVEHARAPASITVMPFWRPYPAAAFDTLPGGPAAYPDSLDAQVGVLAHGGLGCLGPGSDQYPVHAAGDRRQVVVARVASDVVGVGVHREDLVAALPQALVHRVAAMSLRCARDPGDRAARSSCCGPPPGTPWTGLRAQVWRPISNTSSFGPHPDAPGESDRDSSFAGSADGRRSPYGCGPPGPAAPPPGNGPARHAALAAHPVPIGHLGHRNAGQHFQLGGALRIIIRRSVANVTVELPELQVPNVFAKIFGDWAKRELDSLAEDWGEIQADSCSISRQSVQPVKFPPGISASARESRSLRGGPAPRAALCRTVGMGCSRLLNPDSCYCSLRC